MFTQFKVGCHVISSSCPLPPVEEGSLSWLCGDFFSMADVSLAVTLHRLKFLGLSRRYWGNGNRVNLETYYERVVERPAFRRVLGHVNNILISAVLPVAFRVARKNAPVILGTTLLIGVLGGATYLAFLYMKKRLTLTFWGRRHMFSAALGLNLGLGGRETQKKYAYIAYLNNLNGLRFKH